MNCCVCFFRTLLERRVQILGLLLAGVMARDMKAQAPGPAGADRKPVADLLFILSADMVGAVHADLCPCHGFERDST